MLGNARIVAFIATADPAAAQRFYEGVLGLRLVEDAPFALVFEGGGTMLRIQKVDSVTASPTTALGWHVDDIRDMIGRLTSNGVVFQRFEGLPQDELGVWTTPDGSLVAWFKDPDGNTLSLTQFV